MATQAPPKFDASPLLVYPFALGARAHRKLMQALDQSKATEKISAVRGKVEDHYASKKDLCLAVIGLVLVLYGVQFKRLLLCAHVVVAFLYDRMKGAILSVHADVQTVVEKMQEDAPAAPPAKDTTADDQSKHAKKREAKKNAAVAAPSAAGSLKEDAEAARKVLKVLDQERVSSAGTEFLVCLMACVLVLQGGLAQKVAVTVLLVRLLADTVDAMLEYPGDDSMQVWVRVILRVVLYILVFPGACVLTPLVLAAYASALGAKLLVEHGGHAAQAFGKLADADAFLASKKAVLAMAGTAAFGTLWQLWTWLAGGGIYWPVQVLLSPAVLVEAILGGL